MASEIRLPFGVNANGGIATVSDPVRLAKQHLRMVLGTRPGERVMRPEYGVDLEDFVFVTDDDPLVAELRSRIEEAVSENVRGVQVRTVTPEVSAAFSDGEVGVNVEFSLTNALNEVVDTVLIGGGSE